MPLLNVPVHKIKIENSKCPCCNNDNFLVVNQNNPFKINLDICKYCGFIFRSNWLDNESYYDFFRHNHKSLPGINYVLKEWQKSSTLNLNVDQLKSPNKNIRHLDIGSGIGIALDTLGTSAIGIELSEVHLKYAKFQYDLDIRNTLEIRDGHFDVITSFNSLMFIPKIGSFLIDIRSKLKEDGVFIISAPLIDLANSEYLRNNFALEYCNFFTEKTLLNILGISGFSIVKIDRALSELLVVCKRGTIQELQKWPEDSIREVDKFKRSAELLMTGKFEELKMFNPNVIEAWIGSVQKHVHDIGFMRNFAEEMIAKFPDDILAKGMIGNLFYNHQVYDRAIELLESAISKRWSYDMFMNLSYCYHDVGIFDLAAKNLNQALMINPYALEMFHHPPRSQSELKEFEGRDAFRLMAAYYSQIRI